jgi:hypothetical protein
MQCAQANGQPLDVLDGRFDQDQDLRITLDPTIPTINRCDARQDIGAGSKSLLHQGLGDTLRGGFVGAGTKHQAVAYRHACETPFEWTWKVAPSEPGHSKKRCGLKAVENAPRRAIVMILINSSSRISSDRYGGARGGANAKTKHGAPDAIYSVPESPCPITL